MNTFSPLFVIRGDLLVASFFFIPGLSREESPAYF